MDFAQKVTRTSFDTQTHILTFQLERPSPLKSINPGYEADPKIDGPGIIFVV